MENTNRERRAGFTWPEMIAAALFFAGVSESLRNLWRLIGGEEALVPLLSSLVFAAAGAVTLRLKRRGGTDTAAGQTADARP